MQGAVGLGTGAAKQRERDGVQVDAAVTVSMRAGKLEIRVRRGIERVRPRRGHRAVLRNELEMDADLFAARERGRQRAGGLALAHRLFALLFAD